MRPRAFFLLLTTLSSTPAFAYSVADFDCCHLPAPDRQAARPLTIRILPLEDRRDLPGPAEELPYRAGVIRGGYGNPFAVLAKKPVLDYLTTAIAEQLRGLGHTVEVGGDGPADLTIRGRVDALDFDVSSLGTFKQHGRVRLLLEGQGHPTDVDLSVETHDTSAPRLGLAPSLQRQAKEWYGKKGIKWAHAAALESLCVQLAVQVTDSRQPAYAMLVR